MLKDDIHFSRLCFGVKGDNPAQLTKSLSDVIGQDLGVHSVHIRKTLNQILKTSLSGVGDGVGIFDWVSDDITTPYLLCAKLDTPVTVPSVDDRAIDIALAVVSPERHGPRHLQRLSGITRLFRDPFVLEKLRSVSSVDGMHMILLPDNRDLLAA